MTEARFLVADDHEVVRIGIRALLEERDGWQVIAEACDGAEALTKANELGPDVAILDIRMPVMSGLDVARLIAKSKPKTKVLIVTSYECDQLIWESLEIGVRGYLLKSEVGQDLVAAADHVLHNRTFFTPRACEMVLGRYLKGSKTLLEDVGASRLTARQKEIVRLLAQGKTNKQVAKALSLSVRTADTHRANIMRRLNFHSTAELVRYAVRNQIL
jgi:DNA-binding NarL/FixJ family response regulator